MATKEQIEAAQFVAVGYGYNATHPELGAIIDAALAVPVSPSAYSDEQVERAISAWDEVEEQDDYFTSKDCVRAALAAAGVQPQRASSEATGGEVTDAACWGVYSAVMDDAQCDRTEGLHNTRNALNALLAQRACGPAPKAAVLPVARFELTGIESEAMADSDDMKDLRIPVLKAALRRALDTFGTVQAAPKAAAPVDHRIKWTGEFDEHGMPVAAAPKGRSVESIVEEMRVDHTDANCLNYWADRIEAALVSRLERLEALEDATDVVASEEAVSEWKNSGSSAISTTELRRLLVPAPVAAPKRTARELGLKVREFGGFGMDKYLDELVSRLERLEGEAGR